ncbi:MAG: hypothetical protein GAK28_04518 [Luteibacter sp.]|uniref:hypothetical protein n=1 Tax=Luteibacter sp. TaxID=1886636 RepID=UPI0013804D7C|nr:hypothetical protein [Luteibacter sp.]KAF1003750.1 MAG: hypothetical protein GAK28_04518 [Luteibacter sp.]
MIRSTHLLALLASFALFACHHTTQRTHDATRNGEEVAQAMNARFYDTVAACSDNKPAYYCSGVFVRTGPETDGFWNPRQGNDRYVVSFSYLRNDVGLRAIFTGQAGYSLKPASAWGTDGLHELTVRCAFAFNAFTEDRGPYGCGATKSDPIESGPCLDQGIVTKEAFAKHYTSVGEPSNPGDFAKRGAHQCSFGVDPFSFELSILGRMEG